jgi:hypothetical protein
VKVFVGCEYSATVATAFHKRGHDVVTCDLLPSESDEIPHIQGDIYDAIDSPLGPWYSASGRWDLIILHPPCTALCVAGNRHYSGTQERTDALDWTVELFKYCILASERVALENPVGVLSQRLGPATQYIQPWQFGHPETKKTGLWLHNLPPLEPTNIVYDEMMGLPMKERHRIWYASPSEDRGKERSRFYTGFAEAMAEQWGSL